MWIRLLSAVAVTLLLAQSGAFAQAWPARQIRVLIPFGAGSATDVVPRIVFDQLAPALGQPIIVENRVGAGGTLATGLVAKAEPDGYTFLATSSAHTITPSVYSKLPYDTARDLSGVIPFGSVSNVLVIAPSKGIKTIKELVAAAKAKPGSFNFASVGVGSGTHLSVEKLKLAAKFDAVHVPFRGGPEALTELIAGRVELYFCPVNTALPYIREGKLVALVVNSDKRVAELPDVPTVAEAGYPDAALPIWLGMFAPAKTPRAIVERMHAETAKVLANPAVRERLYKTGVEPMPISPAEFDALVRKEIETNAALIKAAGIKPN
jgi:tripartite-type tricarboxylate transporter receptor subunit TctC